MGRPLIAVYHWVRRSYNPLGKQGKWTLEEDIQLKDAVLQHGTSDWSKISTVVSRTRDDCRDRWRNHCKHRDSRKYGPWSKEEEDELTKIVLEETKGKGLDTQRDVLWNLISTRMGHRRSQQQCREKWFHKTFPFYFFNTDCVFRLDDLSKKVTEPGAVRGWTYLDAFILVHK